MNFETDRQKTAVDAPEVCRKLGSSSWSLRFQKRQQVFEPVLVRHGPSPPVPCQCLSASPCFDDVIRFPRYGRRVKTAARARVLLSRKELRLRKRFSSWRGLRTSWLWGQ